MSRVTTGQARRRTGRGDARRCKEVESGGLVTHVQVKKEGVDPQMLVDEFGDRYGDAFSLSSRGAAGTNVDGIVGLRRGQGRFRFIKRL